MDDYGIKIAGIGKEATSKNRKDLHFTSATATYMVAKKITVTVNSDPYVVIHNLGYIPKVFVFQVLSDHNRRLPYKPAFLTDYDFSITKNEVKIRGTTSGTFVIYVFTQPIF